MCGLIAIISKKKKAFWKMHTNAFTQLLFTGQLRGTDGSGIFYDLENKIKIVKTKENASFLTTDPEWEKTETEMFREATFMVGHNRAATLGKVTTENSHPFKVQHITLVHNGTIQNHEKLKKVPSDSQAITYSIAEQGIEKTLKQIQGAFALIWYNNKTKTLHTVRNNQRPLYLLDCEDCFILVSEEKMGLWIADRNKIKVLSTKEVPTKTILTWDMEDPKEYTEKEVTFYEYTTPPYKNHPISKYYNNQKKSNISYFNKTTETKPTLGTKITFEPNYYTSYDKNQILFGKLEQTEIVKYYTKDLNEVKELLKHKKITGIIKQIGYNPTNKKSFFVVKDVEPYTEQVPNSYNGIKITQQLFTKLTKTTCSYCSAPLNLHHLTDCWIDIDEKTKEIDAFCTDCTDFLYKEIPYHYQGI